LSAMVSHLSFAPKQKTHLPVHFWRWVKKLFEAKLKL